jgi:CheY-like chemotaxis protein
VTLPLTTLIVEDDFIIADDLKHTVSNLGYTCVGTAASGEEAVSKAREVHPDILLMDIRLRGKMTGADAARLIRNERPVPVVFLSAFVPNIEGERGCAFVPKPFSVEQLRRAMDSALGDMQPA